MPVILPKDPVTSSFTRAVNAGHTEAVARARMQQQQPKPVNTRPLDENANLHQAIARANQARDAIQTALPTNLKIAVATALWPEMNYKGVSLKQKILSGRTLSDSELRQLFHEFDLLKATRHENVSRFVQRDIEKQLTHNMITGPDALITHDGYVIIGEQAYGSKQALQKAVEDLAYFEKHEKHLPALPYPIQDNLPRQYYPDVMEKVNNLLSEVVHVTIQESKKGFLNGTKPLFEKMFKNNGSWDTQVGHGLPGQILDKANRLINSENSLEVKTVDQYALFKGQTHRAGYISNFVFGYASAVSGIPKEIALIIAQGIALKSNLMRNQIQLDNSDDQRGIKEGWNAWTHNN